MKIKILFLAPYNNQGIGWWDRKYALYFQHLPEEYFEKYFVCVCTEKKTAPQDTILLYEDEIVDFITEKWIEYVYFASAKISADTKSRVLDICTGLINVNFTPCYTTDPRILNLIISKTDYWKLMFMHKSLSNSYVVYNPIDVDNWVKLSAETDKDYRDRFAGKKYIIGRLARAEPSKWHFLMVATLLYLQKKSNYQYGFIFAGMPYLYRKFLRIVLNKEMYASILFLPELRALEDIGRFYRSIDLFWQTSRIGESFGNVIAEAFCFKVPVMTDFKGFYQNWHVTESLYDAQIELVDHKENGRYCVYPEKVMDVLDKHTHDDLLKLGLNWYQKAHSEYHVLHTGNTIARILYDEGRKKWIYNHDDTFENIAKIPWERDVERYKEIYLQKLTQCYAANEVGTYRRVSYYMQERLWRAGEYLYLSYRKFLQLVCKKNIESF